MSKAIPQGEQQRARQSAYASQQAVKGATAESALRNAKIRQRFSNRDAAAFPDWIGCREQWNHKPDCNNTQIDPYRYGKTGYIEIQKDRHGVTQGAATNESSRQSRKNSSKPQQQRLTEVDTRNLPACPTDSFHHADLPDLRTHQRGQQIDDENPAQ